VPGNVHEATVSGIHPLARGISEWRLRLDPPEPLAFRPGQFLSVRVGDDAQGNRILRSYSLASSPGADEVSLILKLVEGGPGSRFFAGLQPGDRVHFTGPMGFFVLDFLHPGDVVFGATGVGISPVLPMLRELLARPETGRVILYWGNRDPADLFWGEELDGLARAHPRFAVRRFISGAAPDWTGERGRIVQPIVDELPRLTRPTFYLVGSGDMIRDVKKALVERGVDRKRQIRNEAFFN
jgi:ferredoxin-NADP reductase